MIRLRWIFGIALATLGVTSGCGSNAPQPASPSVATADVAPAGTVPTDEEDESMADLKEHHRHHHHGGFAMFVAMSLDTLGTTPEQKTAIEKIRADMQAKMQPAHDAEKALLLTLADGAAAGKIDQAKVDAAIAAVSSAAAGVHDAIADSLNQLHAVLTPEQRAALAGKVEAHYAVWNQVNSKEEPAEKDARRGHLGKLASELGLSTDQVEKIRANVRASLEGAHVRFDPSETEAYVKAFAAAFASDTFDARALPTAGPANAHIATWGATRMAHFYEGVTPVLTPDQRAKLADSIRRHANYKRTQTST